MTTAVLTPSPVQKFFDNNGNPLAFGLVNTYAAGTSMPIATYTDSTATTPNANPVVLNSRGEAAIWLIPNSSYKYVVTDSLLNTIITTDQIVSQQLLTLYGGIDSGNVNAGVLTFAWPYAGLQNGIAVYYTPAYTNTGATTLNVNNTGVLTVLNQNGVGLSAGQIVQNGLTGVMYLNGNWYLISSSISIPQSGTFTLTCSELSAAVTCTYSVSNYTVGINIPQFAGTSTATTFTATGIPAAILPATSKLLPVAAAVNNGANISTATALVGATTQFYNAGLPGGWTASGTKGLGVSNGVLHTGISLVYNLL